MPNINSSGIACGLWEPVTKGTKLEYAIVTPKANYIAAYGYGQTAWESSQKITPEKERPQKMHNVVVKSEKDLDRLIASHPTLAALPVDAQARKEVAKLSPKNPEVCLRHSVLRRVVQCNQFEATFSMACQLTTGERCTATRSSCKHGEW